MKRLYDAVQRFCARHPRFGIPNLMLYIVAGNAIVYFLMMFTRTTDASALSFLALDTGAVLAQGDFAVAPNENRDLGGVYANYADKRMLLIHWVVDGKDYYNHYLEGQPYFTLEQCSRWMEKLCRITGDEDVGLSWL